MSPADRAIELAIINRGGFLANTRGADPSVGMIHLHQQEIEQYHDRRRSYVTLMNWDDGAGDAAARMFNYGNAEQIVFVGHSWGCGFGLFRDAHQLAERGRDIDLAILYDPVPHNRMFGGKYRAIVGSGPIDLPPNILRAVVYRTVSRDKWWRPFGRDVVPAKGSDTQVIERRYFGAVSDLDTHRPDGVLDLVDARTTGSALPDGSRYIEEPSPLVFHHTIDGLKKLHDRTLQLIDQLLHGEL